MTLKSRASHRSLAKSGSRHSTSWPQFLDPNLVSSFFLQAPEVLSFESPSPEAIGALKHALHKLHGAWAHLVL